MDTGGCVVDSRSGGMSQSRYRVFRIDTKSSVMIQHVSDGWFLSQGSGVLEHDMDLFSTTSSLWRSSVRGLKL